MKKSKFGRIDSSLSVLFYAVRITSKPVRCWVRIPLNTRNLFARSIYIQMDAKYSKYYYEPWECKKQSNDYLRITTTCLQRHYFGIPRSVVQYRFDCLWKVACMSLSIYVVTNTIGFEWKITLLYRDVHPLLWWKLWSKFLTTNRWKNFFEVEELCLFHIFGFPPTLSLVFFMISNELKEEV